MRILITGGAGFLGKCLTDQYLAFDNEVIILSRKSKKSDRKGLSYLQWDGKSISPSAGNTDVVINLAGSGITEHRWTSAFKKEILESRVNATNACVEFIRSAEYKPSVFLSSSAMGWYGGDRGDEFLDEKAAPGKDFLAGICKAWEDAAQGSGIRTVLLRTSVVLGQEGPLIKMARPFRFFVGGRLGNGKQGFSWIHHHDWVRAVLFLQKHAEISGPVNMSSPGAVEQKKVAAAIASALKRPNLLPVPGIMLKLLLGEMGVAATGSLWVIPEVLRKAGFQFEFPEIKPAVAEIIG